MTLDAAGVFPAASGVFGSELMAGTCRMLRTE